MFPLGGEEIVEKILNIVNHNDSFEPVLNDTEEGKSALANLKKEINEAWKKGFCSWRKKLSLLINTSYSIKFLDYTVDVENKDKVIRELQALISANHYLAQ